MTKNGMLSKTISVLLLLAASAVFTACGSAASGEPLLSGTVTGSYGDDSFTAVNGFAVDSLDTSKLIGLGDGPLTCQRRHRVLHRRVRRHLVVPQRQLRGRSLPQLAEANRLT